MPSGEQTTTPKPYTEILRQQIAQGLGELERPTGGLLTSGLSAGLDLGFSLFLMAIVITLAADGSSDLLVELLLASMYAVGFVFVLLGRSELFTEHTTLAVFPVLAGHANLRQLGRLWGLVYVSNVAGAVLFAFIASIVGPAIGVIDPTSFGVIARQLTDHAWWAIWLSAILAGWLMGLLSWLVSAADETMSRLAVTWLVTAAIGLGHLHHSILGTVEVLSGLFAGEGVSWVDFGRFLVWATLGNAIGGAVFVALIKYRHSIQPAPDVSPD